MRAGTGAVLQAVKSRPCALDFAKKVAALKPSPRFVVVLFGGLAFDARIDGTWRHPCTDEYREAYQARYEDAIRALGSTGRPVAVVLPAPPRPGVLSRSYGMDDVTERQGCLREPIEAAIASTGAGAVDVRERLCGGDATCEEQGSDADERRDGIHYEHEQAQELARWLVPEAARVAQTVG
jgi:hypothetical protein